MGKKLSTYYCGDTTDGDYCEVHIDMKEELLYIKYYRAESSAYFHLEEFRGKALRYVEDAAENWTMGIKKLDDNIMYERTLL